MAIYYWVGGSGTWDATTTTNWSLTTGGSGGAGVPTSADEVRINSLSGTASDTISVVSGAVAKLITYTGSVDFSGVGQQLLLYGALLIQAPPPSGQLNITDIVIRAPSGSTTIIAVVPIKNLFVINWASPAAQATISLASDVTCANFYSTSASVSLSPYKLTCSSCYLDGGGQAYACTVSTGIIDVYPTSGVSNAFVCQWSGSLDVFTDLVVNVINAVDQVIVSSASTPLQSTSFSLTVSNSDVYFVEIYGGLDSLTLQSGAIFALNENLDLLGGLAINPGATLTKRGVSNRQVNIRKKTGTPNVSRFVTAYGGSVWSSVGLVNYLVAFTDTLSVLGQIGTSSAPASIFSLGVASKNASDVHAASVTFATGNVFSSTPITVYGGGVFAASGAAITGAFTINALSGTYFSTNNVQLSTVNIYGTGASYGNFRATNLTLVPELGAGTTSFGAQPGSTVTVLGTLSLNGLSSLDNVALQSTPSFGPTGEFFLSKASGTVNATFTAITDCNASGGAIFNAYATNNCVDGGGNTGWNFNPQSGFFIFL